MKPHTRARRLLVSLVSTALAAATTIGCSSTGEKPQEHTLYPVVEAPMKAKWDFSTCSVEKGVAMVVRCRDRDVVISVGYVEQQAPPTEADFRRSENEAINSLIDQLRAAYQVDIDGSPVVEVLKLNGRLVEHTRAITTANGNRVALSLRSVALPKDETDAHFIVLYNCVSSIDGNCVHALAETIVFGGPVVPDDDVPLEVGDADSGVVTSES